MGHRLQQFQNKISYFFQNFDLFGRDIKLNYKNSDKFKTGCGGFASLLFIAFILVVFWNRVTQYIEKKQMVVNVEQIHQENPDLLVVQPSEMIFAIRVKQDNLHQRPLFNITYEDRHYVRNDLGELQKEKNKISLEPCNLDHFKQLKSYNNEKTWEEYFTFYKLNEYLCLPLQTDIKLGGAYISKDFYFQKIQVNQCRNQTELIDDSIQYQSVCAPQDEIDQYKYKTITLEIIFPNKLINPKDPNFPVKSFLNEDVFFEISSSSYHTANIMFKQVTIESDKSLYQWSSKEILTFPLYEQGDFREQSTVNDGDTVGEFYLRRSPLSTVYERNFEKIDNIIVYIGGFIETFIIGASILIGYYNDLAYTLSIANNLYSFEKKKKQKEKDSQVQKQIEDLKQQDQISGNTNYKSYGKSENRKYCLHARDIKAAILERQKILNHIHFQKDDDIGQQNIDTHQSSQQQTIKTLTTEPDQYIITSTNRDINDQHDQKCFDSPQPGLYKGLGFQSKKEFLLHQFQEIIHRDQQNQLSLSIKFILNSLFCGCFKNQEDIILIQKARQKISTDVDLQQMIESIKDIDKLKNVILNEDQRNLFDFFPKPIINTENQKTERVKLKNMSSSSITPLDALDIFQITNTKKFAKKFQKNVGVRKRSLVFNDVYGFQKLFQSYEQINLQRKNNQLSNENIRLFDLLGNEMKEILETSKLIQDSECRRFQINQIITKFRSPKLSDNNIILSPKSTTKNRLIDRENSEEKVQPMNLFLKNPRSLDKKIITIADENNNIDD